MKLKLSYILEPQEARVSLEYALSNSYASFVLSKLPAYFISRHWPARTYEPIAKLKYVGTRVAGVKTGREMENSTRVFSLGSPEFPISLSLLTPVTQAK